MKTIKKEMTIYQAIDGKEFSDITDCIKYEQETFKDINLQHFDVSIPYGDDGLYKWVAYKVNSQNEFNMLWSYLDYNYGDIYGIEEYSGNGWYIVQFSEGDWAELLLLSKVVKDFTKMLAEIAENTMDFKEKN